MELILVSIFGLLIGSFLNVCIWRIPREMSVYNPSRSFCPKCNHKLSILDNIPVISWLLLRAKCRYCKASISGRYPLVEMLSAVGAAASYIYFDLSPTGFVIYCFVATLIVITFIDIDFKIIPDDISLPGIIICLAISVINEFYPIFDYPITSGVNNSLLGVLIGAGFPLAILIGFYFFTKKEGLGMGDIKLLALYGALLGWKAVLPAILWGSIFGSVYGITLMAIGKAGRNTEIPFGPWLALGALIYLFSNWTLFNYWTQF